MAAQMAAKNSLKIYTVGIGSQSRSTIDFFSQSRSSGVDEEALIAIAEMTGGRYYRATDTETFRKIYEQLDQLEPIERKQQQWRPRTDLFYWPLGIALLFGLIGVAIRERSE